MGLGDFTKQVKNSNSLFWDKEDWIRDVKGIVDLAFQTHLKTNIKLEQHKSIDHELPPIPGSPCYSATQMQLKKADACNDSRFGDYRQAATSGSHRQ